MKELKLAVQCDFSEYAVEDSIQAITQEIKNNPVLLELTVSVFDATKAVHMMIDNPTIRLLHITKEFHDGRYCLTDHINDVMITGGLNHA